MAIDTLTLAMISARALLVGRRRTKEDSIGGENLDPEVSEEIARLVRERLEADTTGASTLTAAEEDPKNPHRQQLLQDALVDVVVMDDVFAGKLAALVSKVDGSDTTANAETSQVETGADHASEPQSLGPTPLVRHLRRASGSAPVRGFPGLTVAATSPQTTAGSDFSIFVLVQNPFDVPITIYQVQTHIPVELIDVNRLRAKVANRAESDKDSTEDNAAKRTAWGRIQRRRQLRREHPGVAVAVGTEFSPEEAGQLFRSEVNIGSALNVEQGASANFSAVSFFLPQGASSDELDAMMRRLVDYQRGILPIQLQPGDAVVRQFVLRTRSRLLFRPLSYTFQIQVNYSVDGVDHTGTIPYQLSIQAALGSIVWGAALGAALGTLVKGLTSSPLASVSENLRALVVSLLASGVIAVAFSRKASAQPLISVEDFWGGLVIGFAVGYFGFHQFLGLFPTGATGNSG